MNVLVLKETLLFPSATLNAQVIEPINVDSLPCALKLSRYARHIVSFRQPYWIGVLDEVAAADASKRITPEASVKKWRVAVTAETGSPLAEKSLALLVIVKL